MILVPDAAAALADADGEPALRRLVRSAWSGGALPIVVVARDGTALEAAVADLPVTIVSAPAAEPGIAWFVHGAQASKAAVADVTAALLWPFRYAWIDPETVTSLLEAYGAVPGRILRPSFGARAGFPVLLPASLLDRLAAMTGLHAEEAVARLVDEGTEQRLLELGDPGIAHDVSTPRGDLPAYQGPPGPSGGPPQDWNAALTAHAQRQPKGRARRSK